MFSPAQLRAIFTLAIVAAVVQASWFDGTFLGRRERAVAIRQNGGGGIINSIVNGLTSGQGGASSTSGSSTPASNSASSTSQTSSTPSSTPGSTSSTPSSTSGSSTSSQPSSSSSQTSTSSSSVGKVTTHPGTTKVILQTSTVDGKPVVSSFTSTSPGSTSTGALQDGSSGKSSGMSSKTKTTIIGVVVGIGGFAIVAGLVIVAWKIWGRKKTEEEGDELMSNYGSREKESSASGPSSNPFQSTLDQYHNPARNVNASSNF